MPGAERKLSFLFSTQERKQGLDAQGYVEAGGGWGAEAMGVHGATAHTLSAFPLLLPLSTFACSRLCLEQSKKKK